MTRRKRLALGTLAALALAALALAALAVGLVVALMPTSPEREKFDRVQVGMSNDEVREILGQSEMGFSDPECYVAAWSVPGGSITVEFDRHDCVTAKRYHGRSWFAWARDWLAGKLGL